MRFSIIIPVYNVESFLEECVWSILAQTYREYELILVDDGSFDRCPKMCDDLSHSDERVKVIHQCNCGSSSARNVGLRQASGEYILFIDSDDYICDSNFLEKLNSRINEYNEDVILFGCKIRNPNMTYMVSRSNYDLGILNVHDKERTLDCLFRQNNFPGSAWIMCVRYDLIERNNFQFKIGVTAEDYEWIIKVILASETIGAINDIQYVYRRREESITSKPRLSGIYGTMSAIDYYLNSSLRYKGLSKFISRAYLIALMGVNELSTEDKSKACSLLDRYKNILLLSNQWFEYHFIKLFGPSKAACVTHFLYRIIRRTIIC